MTLRQRKYFLALLLAMLFVSVVLADFQHTEKTCKPDPTCPACGFQNSSLTVSTILFFELPGLRFLAFIETGRIPAKIDSAFVLRSSRAPPQI
jgi:hypothetical protein